jgi:hypothetical protein
VTSQRIATYARGSHQLVVTVQVKGAQAATLQLAGHSYPLRLVGGEASGTVPVSCSGAAPDLTLLLTGADGATVPIPLGTPTDAFVTACAAPLPGAPVPSNSPSRGS